MSTFNYHTFANINTVAIIGAGSSGLIAAKQLVDAGLCVKVFEQHSEVGGAWTIKERKTVDPITPPSEAAFQPIARGRQGSRTFLDDGWGWGWEGSRTTRFEADIARSSFELPDFPSPTTTSALISSQDISSHLQTFATEHDLADLIELNTRVELVERVRGTDRREAWRVRLRRVEKEDGLMRETLWDEFFDAVVVATGNQQAPFIPVIPGLSTFGVLHPVSHSSAASTSRSGYEDIAILIIGAGRSALDTACRLSPHVRKIWISARGITGPEAHQAKRRLERFVLPSNAEVVPLVEGFEEDDLVRLVDGRVLRGIKEVVFATGSLPFLPQYHSDPVPIRSKQPPPSIPPLVTDGTSVQHLHHNTFYIPEPTLAILTPSPTSSSATASAQASAIARVWTRRAALPSQATLIFSYENLVHQREEGRWLNWADERDFTRGITDWLDTHALMAGVPGVIGEIIEGKTEKEKAGEVFVGRYGLTKSQFNEVWDEDERREVEGASAREDMERRVRRAMMRRNGV